MSLCLFLLPCSMTTGACSQHIEKIMERKEYMKNKKQKKNSEKQQNPVNSNQIIIDSKIMADAIVKAYQIIEKEKVEKAIELEKNEKKEWQEIMGQKEYPENEKWYLKRFHIARNNFMSIWNLLFFKSKNVRDLRATFSLIQLAVVYIFKLCKWCLYVISFAASISAFQNGVENLSNLAIAFVIWTFARLFRIASFEVEKVKDGNLLIALFSGCISFVAMVVAIIAIFIE